MNKECQIKDDDEILEEENNRFNFRRFKPDELEKKFSPFERTKKEFPFLFQKKREVPKEEQKISLDEIIMKVNNLQMSSPQLSAIRENMNEVVTISPIPELFLEHIEYSPNTPPWDPHAKSPIPELILDELKEIPKIDIDGQ
jgi:hypothetical protein